MTNEELLKTYFTNRHILQSKEWGQFKTLTGARAVTLDKLQITTHKIPLTPWKVGYAPKIRPEDLDLEKLYETAKKEGLIFVKLDVPHASREFKIQNSKFKIAEGKSIFAQSTILLDLTKSAQELLAAMNEKTRYNIGLAARKGVKVEIYDSLRGPLAEGALTRFIELQKETAKRQGFFVHPDHYYRTCFEILSSHGRASLLEANVDSRSRSEPAPVSTRSSRGGGQTPGVEQTAASWILFRYGDVLYYPYGESDYQYRAYMPSNLLMWESIQLGKNLGCKVFDLWGAADDPNDEADPWHGFTRFKLSFGGLHVKLAPTHDLVINQNLYSLFNFANSLRWKLLRLVR